MEIKDSGARREFESGAVRDIQEGKGRCDLMPLDCVSMVLDEFMLAYLDSFKKTGDYRILVSVLKECKFFSDKYTMFLEVAKQFEQGAKKYGENNWQKGIPTNCYIDSTIRHYLKWFRGDKDEPHDRAVIWNLLCCIWTCINKPELNVYKKEV